VVEGTVWADVYIEPSLCREHKTDKKTVLISLNPCPKTY